MFSQTAGVSDSKPVTTAPFPELRSNWHSVAQIVGSWTEHSFAGTKARHSLFFDSLSF